MSQGLTLRQATLWFAMHQLGSAFLLLPGQLAGKAKQDAWLAVIVALAANLLLVWLSGAIVKRSGGAEFPLHLEKLLGKWTGRTLLFMFILFYPFLIFILVLRDLCDFLKTSVLPETPSSPIYLLMLATVYYVVRSGISIIGRAAEMMFPAVLILFALGYVSLLPGVSMNNLLPVFEFGWKPIAFASFPLVIFPYAECVLFLFLMPYIRQSREWKQTVLKSSLLSGSMFLIVTLLAEGTLGSGYIANLAYPSYYIIGTVSIGNFYERFEVLVTIMWYITIFFRLALLLYVSAYGFAGVFKLNQYKSLLLPLSMVAFMLADTASGNTTQLLNSFEAWPFYSMLFSMLFPAMIWVIGLIRKP